MYSSNLKSENLGNIFDGTKDWRDSGVVTPMKNQGRCGSCWAFSAVAAMESDYAIKHNKLVVMSEQQSVDCVRNASCCFGCRGGFMDPVFQWHMDTQQGVVTEAQYPYTGRDTAACRRIPSAPDQAMPQRIVQVNGGRTLGERVEHMVVAIKDHPIAVAIEAENNWFRGYRGGVITQGCGQRLDHAVLAVGYGATAAGQEYWIVKNSWGTSWGEQGYVRIAPFQCGIWGMPSHVYMQ